MPAVVEGLVSLNEIGRRLNVHGETLITVRGGAHFSGQMLGFATELGLASPDTVKIIPTFHKQDVFCDATGPHAPADVQNFLTSVQIKATLVHYNPEVLELLINESMGGGSITPINAVGFVGRAGYCGPAGKLMAGRKQMHASGNRFFSVSLFMGGVSGGPFRFVQCHLTDRPLVLPIGTKVSMAEVNFRALPYIAPIRLLPGQNPGEFVVSKAREVGGSGGVVWDRNIDQPVEGEPGYGVF